MKKLLDHKLFLLVLINIAIRIVIYSFESPAVYPDSVEYIQAAKNIESLQWLEDNGKRVPFYPLVIVLMQNDLQAVVGIQLIFGVIISSVLYLLIRLISHNDVLAFWCGLSYSLNVGQLFFEINILSETTATMLLSLIAYLMMKCIYAQSFTAKNAIILGLCSLCLVLTKPVFIFIPFASCAIILFKLRLSRFRYLIYFISIVSIGITSVVVINGITREYYGITTLAGFNLINHTGKFIESSTIADSSFKEIYTTAREQKMAETGNQSMTIHTVKKKLMDSKNSSFEELSKYLFSISLNAIWHAPAAYSQSVLESTIKFWKPSLRYNSLDTTGFGSALIYIENRILVLFYIVFILGSFLSLFRIGYFNSSHFIDVHFIMLIVFLQWIISSMLEYGENHRYKICCEPLIISVGIYYLFSLYRIQKNVFKETYRINY